MSDDEQGAIPPEDEQTPADPESSAEAPEGDASAEPAADAQADAEGDPAPEGAAESAEPEPEMDPDAAAALAAAQAAVADALKGDLGGGDDTDVASAQEMAEATGEDLEAMMAAAIEAEKAEQGGGAAAGADAQPFGMPEFSPAGLPPDSAEMQLLGDVNVDVRIELGRTRMLVEDVLKLGSGAVVELEKLAGDPVDVFVNGRHVARGEVLVLNESFCVRVNEVLEPVTIESTGD